MSSRRLKAKRQRKANEKRYQSDPDHGTKVEAQPKTEQKRSKSDPQLDLGQESSGVAGMRSRPRSSDVSDIVTAYIAERYRSKDSVDSANLPPVPGGTVNLHETPGSEEMTQIVNKLSNAFEASKKKTSEDSEALKYQALAKELHTLGESIKEYEDETAEETAWNSLSGFLSGVPNAFRAIFSSADSTGDPMDAQTNANRIPEDTLANRRAVLKEIEEKGGYKVPAEVRARGPEACVAYQDALADGKTRDRRLPLMVVGQARAGKTSTIRSLRGEEFNPEEDSTVGITLERSLYELKKDPWGNQSDEEGAAELSYDHVMAKAIAEKLTMDQEEQKPGYDIPNPSSTNHRTNAASKDAKAGHKESKKPVQVPENIAALIQDLLKDIKDDKSSTGSIYSLTWDFAGQPTYCATHPVFLSPRAIYLLVHDLSTDLHAEAIPMVKSGEYQRRDVSLQRTNMDWLELWMSSICQISDEQCSIVSEEAGSNSNRNSDVLEFPVLGDSPSTSTEGASKVDLSDLKTFKDITSNTADLSNTQDAISRSPDMSSLNSLNESLQAGNSDNLTNGTLPDFLLSQPPYQGGLGSNGKYNTPLTPGITPPSHSGRPDHVRNRIKLPKKVPPVLLVCTHKDTPYNGQDPVSTSREILRTLKGKTSGHHLVRAVYTVENKSTGKTSEDPGIRKLRENIHEIAQKLPQMREYIPIRWLRFENAVNSLVQKGFKCIKLPEARKIAQDVCEIPEREFRHMLNYLHDMKVIIHFEETLELNRLVILDPQWLVEMFASIITVQPVDCQDEDYMEDWSKLEDDGVLSLALVRHVWEDLIDDSQTVDTLLSIMQKFSLLCKWRTNDGSEVFLVPSMLMSQALDEVQDLVSSASLVPLVVQFSSGFLPLGFFPRFLVLLVQWCAQKWPHNRQPRFFNNFARFFVGSKGNFSLVVTCDLCTLALVVRRETPPSGINFLPMARDNTKPPPLEDTRETLCQNVVSFVKKTLKKMRLDYPWMRTMQAELNVRCPVCVQQRQSVPCKTHNVKACTRDACMHYIPENDLRTSPIVTCLQSPTASQPVINQELYSPWLQEEEDESYRDGVSLVLDDSGRELFPRTMKDTLASEEAPVVAAKLSEYLEIDRKSLLTPSLPVAKRIRLFCRYLKNIRRTDIVMSLREILPSGVTGPLFPDNASSRLLPPDKRLELTQALSGGDEWKIFASHLGVPADQLRFYDQRTENPTERVLSEFERKSNLKIGELYDILVICGLTRFAEKL